MAKVLVVEDDPDAAERMLECLSLEIKRAALSHEVVLVTNVQDAVNSLLAEAYDLVSLDGRFPVRPGGHLDTAAGLTLLPRLDLLGHRGHTVFYAGSDEQLPQARRMIVAGKPVHARAKALTHSVEDGRETTSTWAKMCADLLKT